MYDGSIRLLDFEWAGKMGEVCYPADLNINNIFWHSGVEPGAKITHEHDKYQIDKLLQVWF